VYELSEKILAVYMQFMHERDQYRHEHGDLKLMNKEGLIQLLFDIRFIFDILSGRKEMESIKEQQQLRQALSSFKPTNTSTKTEVDELDQVIQWNNKFNKLVDLVQSEVQ
jgi:hypothetical protein